MEVAGGVRTVAAAKVDTTVVTGSTIAIILMEITIRVTTASTVVATSTTTTMTTGMTDMMAVTGTMVS